MDSFGYLSNAYQKGYNISNSWDALIKEFEKGNISYPRTDSENHFGIEVINSNYIMPQVKALLTQEPKYLLREDLMRGDFFMMSKMLKLATPASIVNDYEFVIKTPINNNIDKSIIFTGLYYDKFKKRQKDNLIPISKIQELNRIRQVNLIKYPIRDEIEEIVELAV